MLKNMNEKKEQEDVLKIFKESLNACRMTVKSLMEQKDRYYSTSD